MHGGTSPFFLGSPFFTHPSPTADEFSYTPNNDSGFFGLISRYITDLEGLLLSLSSVCTGNEKEVIGMFLNLIRAKNFYDTYGELLKSQFSDTDGLANLFSGLGDFGNLFQGVQETSPNPSKTPDYTPDTGPLNVSSFGPDLSSMLNDEQKETLELLKSLFSDES